MKFSSFGKACADTMMIRLHAHVKNAFQNEFWHGIEKILFHAVAFSFWNFSKFFGIFRHALDAGISLSLNVNHILEPFVCCVGFVFHISFLLGLEFFNAMIKGASKLDLASEIELNTDPVIFPETSMYLSAIRLREEWM